MPSRPTRRLIAASAAATLLAAALGGCGRKGPLELPPDVQAAREASRAAQEAAAPKAPAGQKPKLSEEGAKPKAGPQEGDVGHRPPEAYPFFLDPLL